MQDFSIVDKKVGETPLQALERFRHSRSNLEGVAMAYAGRLDPMASGQLLVLIGDECKRQSEYHSLDKEYEFEVLFGIGSDTGDVLGLIHSAPVSRPAIGLGELHAVCKKLIGEVELPYPHFSSKTVHGKPLHVWTLEGRLNEIDIPTKQSSIYALSLLDMYEVSNDELYKTVSEKIETIPKVTEIRKALGNDFRRPLVRESWKSFHAALTSQKYIIAKFRCIASSGTYMRTLAEVIAKELNTYGLAYSIHRTKIGRYTKLPFGIGFWNKRF